MASNTVDCKAAFQKTLGGALMSLNVRAARRAIENGSEWPWTVKTFQEALQDIPVNMVDVDKPNRSTVTDDDVRAYVKGALDKSPTNRHTNLLRLYREAGFACEQKRFRRLFIEVEKNYAGTK